MRAEFPSVDCIEREMNGTLQKMENSVWNDMGPLINSKRFNSYRFTVSHWKSTETCKSQESLCASSVPAETAERQWKRYLDEAFALMECRGLQDSVVFFFADRFESLNTRLDGERGQEGDEALLADSFARGARPNPNLSGPLLIVQVCSVDGRVFCDKATCVWTLWQL